MKDIFMNYIFIYIGIVNIITFILYGIDKHKAKKHKWRIPEKTLLGLNFTGGFLGGLLGMQFVHHKTKHWYFYAAAVLSAALWLFLIYMLYK